MLNVGWIVFVTDKYLLEEYRPRLGVPSVEVFLKEPNTYLRIVCTHVPRRQPKLLNGQAYNVTYVRTQPLIGCKIAKVSGIM